MNIMKFDICDVTMNISTEKGSFFGDVFSIIDHHPTAFICSRSTIETLEYGVKMFQVNNKDNRTMPMASFWCFYC